MCMGASPARSSNPVVTVLPYQAGGRTFNAPARSRLGYSASGSATGIKVASKLGRMDASDNEPRMDELSGLYWLRVPPGLRARPAGAGRNAPLHCLRTPVY